MKTTHVTLALIVLLMSSCLPDRLTEDQVGKKITEAACGADPGAPDDNQGCSDGNDEACDSCESCGKRQVLRIETKSDLLVASTDGVPGLKIGQDDSFTLELWFKASKKVVNGSYSLIAGRVNEKSKRYLAIGVKGVQGGNGLSPVCMLNANEKSDATFAIAEQQVLQPLQWHHIICAYDGSLGVLGVTADSEPMTEQKVLQAGTTEGDLFAAGDLIVVGQIEPPDAKNIFLFQGSVDEVRWSKGYPKKKPEFKRRYADDDANSVFIFHMDGPATGAAFGVKSADGKMTAAALLSTHTLSFGKDACYEDSGYAMLCELIADDDKPDWCWDSPNSP